MGSDQRIIKGGIWLYGSWKQLLEEIGNFRKYLMYILIEIQRAFTAVKLQQEVMKKKQFEIR